MESKVKMSITGVTKKKYLEINLAKEVKDLYNVNYKTLTKVIIKDTETHDFLQLL